MAAAFADPAALGYDSRRSPVLSTGGCVATSQPLASDIGLQVLRGGGNAADACVAAVAALNVTEPCMCGVGGDARAPGAAARRRSSDAAADARMPATRLLQSHRFCLYYDASTKTVRGLNGSGRSPRDMTLGDVGAPPGARLLDVASPHCVTVPGAAACWADAAAKFGTRPLAELLEPAARLAERGAPVHRIAATNWKASADQIGSRWKGTNPGEAVFLPGGAAPATGALWKNPDLVSTRVGTKGHDVVRCA